MQFIKYLSSTRLKQTRFVFRGLEHCGQTPEASVADPEALAAEVCAECREELQGLDHEVESHPEIPENGLDWGIPVERGPEIGLGSFNKIDARQLARSVQNAGIGAEEFRENMKFTEGSVRSSDLLVGLDPVLEPLEEIIEIPERIDFITSENLPFRWSATVKSQLKGEYNENGEAVYDRVEHGSIFLNLSSPYGVADYSAANYIRNEYAHQVNAQLMNRYLGLKREKGDDTPAREIESSVFSDFENTNLLPSLEEDQYSYTEFNELLSDVMHHAGNPEHLPDSLRAYGSPEYTEFTENGELNYRLNRDFTTFHLSQFLRENGYGEYSQAEIESDCYQALYQASMAEDEEAERAILDQYKIDDPAFVAYLGAQYNQVGTELYQHFGDKIRAAELEGALEETD